MKVTGVKLSNSKAIPSKSQLIARIFYIQLLFYKDKLAVKSNNYAYNTAPITNKPKTAQPTEIINSPLYKFFKAFRLQQYAKVFLRFHLILKKIMDFGYTIPKIIQMNQTEANIFINNLKVVSGHRAKFACAIGVLKEMYSTDKLTAQTDPLICTKMQLSDKKSTTKTLKRSNTNEFSREKINTGTISTAKSDETIKNSEKQEIVEKQKVSLGVAYFLGENVVPKKIDKLFDKYEEYINTQENNINEIHENSNKPIEITESKEETKIILSQKHASTCLDPNSFKLASEKTLEINQLCKCLAHAIIRHIELSKNKPNILEIESEPISEKIPESFSDSAKFNGFVVESFANLTENNNELLDSFLTTSEHENEENLDFSYTQTHLDDFVQTCIFFIINCEKLNRHFQIQKKLIQKH